MHDSKEALFKCLFFVQKVLPLLVMLVLAWPATAAPTIEQLRPLSFGTLGVPGNAGILNLVLQPNNSVQLDPGLVVISAPETGQFRLTNFPPNVALEVSVTDSELTAGGSGLPEKFNATQYTTPSLFSGPEGAIEFALGATLRTSGSGNNYIDAPYLGAATLSVRYWSSEAGGYLTAFESIELQAATQTSISLVEEQALYFGTLFARATSTHQAELILAPNGEVNINNSGNSRLVQLSAARPGVLRVVGAAPNYTVSITAQAGTIELRHETSPGLPRFLVSDFVTSPSASGVTNAQGELLLTVGATLRTALTAGDQVYPPGKYSGTYEITVAY